jgi:hypothetical protein
MELTISRERLRPLLNIWRQFKGFSNLTIFPDRLQLMEDESVIHAKKMEVKT